jgi:hypothetical protein
VIASEPKPELTSIFVRVHTRVKGEKPRTGDSDARLPDKWARYALVFDCETTIDIRQDLTFLWWRFCALKNDVYVCQQEGLVYADDLKKQSIRLIRDFACRKLADVEDGCPTDILVQSRTEFVDGEFWDSIVAGAAIVCFNAPFDLSRLALNTALRRTRTQDGQWFCGLERGDRTSSGPS